jgi:hypothetical protein
MTAGPERRLYVAWRRPDGLTLPVGVLSRVSDDAGRRFRFVYLKRAEGLDGFELLPGLPDLHRLYDEQSLFPVFANRVMPRERSDYASFIEQLDLTGEADPFEVLARSEGVRSTDRIEVFPCPRRDDNRALTTLFFARGIRHVPEASAAVEQLSRGDELALVDDSGNDVNPRAFLLNTQTGEQVGWAPDYLVETIHDLRELNGESPTVHVEHVNPPTVAPHLRLLCRLSAVWPHGFEPFSGPEFQPIVEPFLPPG